MKTNFQIQMRKWGVAILAISFVANAYADNKQYWWQMYDSNSNSSVSLTTDQGSAVAATLNPTGANAMAATTAATAPSVTTRIRLTTAIEGNACSLPRDDLAITADRSLILVCKSSIWVRNGGLTGVTTYSISVGTTVHLGYHLFCAISSLQGDPPAGSMQAWPNSGPNQDGQYDWYASNYRTGEFWSPSINISCFA